MQMKNGKSNLQLNQKYNTNAKTKFIKAHTFPMKCY